MNSDILNTKSALLTQISYSQESHGVFFKNVELQRQKIARFVDISFKSLLSTSVIVVDNSSSQALSLVESIVSDRHYECAQSYDYYGGQQLASKSNSRHNSAEPARTQRCVARIKGSVTPNDHDAIIGIADQFLLGKRVRSNLNSALEDLEEHFQQCCIDRIPAVIIIEDFHIFATKRRQMLIYTLLDLMQKRDMLFTVSQRVMCTLLNLNVMSSVLTITFHAVLSSADWNNHTR